MYHKLSIITNSMFPIFVIEFQRKFDALNDDAYGCDVCENGGGCGVFVGLRMEFVERVFHCFFVDVDILELG